MRLHNKQYKKKYSVYNIYKSEVKEPHKQTYKKGVLLVNLGTPADLSYKTLRKYYAQFIGDARVVERPPLFWKTLLQLVLLQIIPLKGRAKYRMVWNKQKNESPLLTTTRSQAEALQALYEKQGVVVEFAMRYGNPSIEEKMDILKQHGVQELVILPLYPQYSASTVASVYDEVFRVMQTYRWMPELKMVMNYHKHPSYIHALKNSVQTAYNNAAERPQRLVCSYHGIPKSYWKKGDPYPCHCFETTKKLTEALGFKENEIISTFQSRFGREEWVKPYTDDVVKKLVEDGVTNIAVISPAFASDCVETLEELDMELKDVFLDAGGVTYTRLPCLNASDDHIMMMKHIVDDKLGLK